MKEFWKSVKNRQSYRHDPGVLIFWNMVYFDSTMFNVDFIKQCKQNIHLPDLKCMAL